MKCYAQPQGGLFKMKCLIKRAKISLIVVVWKVVILFENLLFFTCKHSHCMNRVFLAGPVKGQLSILLMSVTN